MSWQKPLPTSPFPDSVQLPESADKDSPRRENSQHSAKSRDSEDVDMDESDGEGANGEDGTSDGESVNADGSRSNKKKKSQRFYCTDYPPCNLSFTRSEHLARHIRKHTGERPFQCHCSRRFSRLDNLRQHAQTVHVNEDIPNDSLAATGTRFQRQIRTDRVRQVGGRARASTAGSIGSTGRGHSKSLSTSSITSASSISSNYSTIEARRRPPPLVMADPRARMPLDPYRTSVDPQFYRQPSPSDWSTPISATFSTEQSSPRWGSGVASPISSHSRSHSMYAGSRTPGRRLSVPSGSNPFHSPHGINVGRPGFGPGMINSPGAGGFSTDNSGLLSSPTTSNASWSRRESISSTADEAWRRRTWHPDSREFTGGSRLNQVITPSQLTPSPVPLPIANPAQQSHQSVRLPGIESFDPIPQHHPLTPPRRIPSPMMIDSESPSRPTLLPSAEAASEDRRNVTAHWDMGLHRGLTRLDLNTPPRDSAGSWASETSQAVLAQGEPNRPNPGQPTVRFNADVKTVQVPQDGPPMTSRRHHHTMSAPLINTPRELKRRGWYHGPVAVRPAGETIPEGRPHVDRIVHPNVSGFQGFPARDHHQPVIHQHAAGPTAGQGHSSGDPNSLRRLEALVAVATSEGSTATAC